MKLVGPLLAVLAIGAEAQRSCPGYRARNIKESDSGVTADLQLAGRPCNVYGTDLPNLTLTVEYQNGMQETPHPPAPQLIVSREPASRDHSRPEQDSLPGS